MKKREGFIYERNPGVWYARVTYTDDSGKRRDLRRKGGNKSAANRALNDLLEEIGQPTTGQNTFNILAEYYEKNFAKDAEYVHETKVAGLRSADRVLKFLKQLKLHFNELPITKITPGVIEKYKQQRLKTPKKDGTQRSIASVNRELEVLRRMLFIAEGEGWIKQNPFSASNVTLISKADERKRERILSKEEEATLLKFCSGPRSHIRPIIIAALDTGMRRGEIFQLKWEDVDLETGFIFIKGFYTKTATDRRLKMTPRLQETLKALWQLSDKDKTARIFGVKDNIRKAFGTARRLAGLEDVRFHDLRHTAATKMVKGGLAIGLAGKILGHTQLQTTLRYINTDDSTLEEAAKILSND